MKQGKTLEQLGTELQRQRSVRADFIADTRQLNFKTDNNKSRITFKSGNKTMDFGINQLAHQQIASRLGIPLKYYQRMQAESAALLDENVNNWLEQTPARRMIRVMDGNVRAFLSDRYRRLDNLELCAAVLPIIREMKGAVIESCEVTEAHLYLKVTNKRLKAEVDDSAYSRFQKLYAQFADELSSKKIDFKLFVSLNPAHFITMSNPKDDRRGDTLTSCHSFNSTNYSYNNGCSGYARDDYSFITFIAANPNDSETLNNRKIMRQMFAYKVNNGLLLQSRLYNTSVRELLSRYLPSLRL